MNKEISSYRKEIKYVIPTAKVRSIESALERFLIKDNYCSDGKYNVRSLYFDSLNNMDFVQKLSGISERKKIRIRIYNDNVNLCKLEIKQKFGEWQHKQSLSLSGKEAGPISCGHYGELIKYFENSKVATKAYTIMNQGGYRPVVMITYDRIAFQHPLYNTRITLDTDIRATESNLNIFSPIENHWPVIAGNAVLEVKYSGKMLGFISNVLSQFNLTQSSFSKYCFGRKIYYDFNY